jgi:hypothetical protein
MGWTRIRIRGGYFHQVIMSRGVRRAARSRVKIEPARPA